MTKKENSDPQWSKSIKRKQFFNLTGEYPEDVLGQDWENIVDDYI